MFVSPHNIAINVALTPRPERKRCYAVGTDAVFVVESCHQLVVWLPERACAIIDTMIPNTTNRKISIVHELEKIPLAIRIGLAAGFSAYRISDTLGLNTSKYF